MYSNTNSATADIDYRGWGREKKERTDHCHGLPLANNIIYFFAKHECKIPKKNIRKNKNILLDNIHVHICDCKGPNAVTNAKI